MKKIISSSLVILLLFSMFIVGMVPAASAESSQTAQLSGLFENSVRFWRWHEHLNDYAMIYRVYEDYEDIFWEKMESELPEDREIFENGLKVPAAEYEEKLYKYFEVSDFWLDYIRQYTKYDAAAQTYTVEFMGGWGGPCDRDYAGFVNKGEYYEIYLCDYDYISLQDLLPEGVDMNDYLDSIGNPMELEYEGIYFDDFNNFKTEIGFKNSGLMFRAELNGSTVRFLSVQEFTADDMPVSFDDSPAEPVTYTLDAGVKISEHNAFLPGTNVSISVIEKEKADLAMKDISREYIIFDITAKIEDMLYQPRSSVTVTLPIPEGYSDDVVLYYMNNKGVLSELDAVKDFANREITVTLDHFSTYILADKAADPSILIPGDVNGDGEVNIRDAATVLLYVSGKEVSYSKLTIDANGDGQITKEDADAIIKNIAGHNVELVVTPCSHDDAVIYPATPATCTTAGVTEGKYCPTCDLTLATQVEVPAKGHTEVIDDGVPPTCTQSGLSQGTHCSDCGEVLIPQSVIEATPHATVTIPGTPAGERSFGKTEHVYCSTCSVVVSESTLILPLGIENPDYYASDWGYNYLATLPNGAAMQQFYLALDAEVKDFHVNTDRVPDKNGYLNAVRYDVFGLSDDEARTVYSIYKDDHPLYYWISNRSAIYPGTSFLVMVDEDYSESAVRAYYNDLIYDVAADYLKLTIGETSEYQICWALHDAICLNSKYAYKSNGTTPESASWAHNILGIIEKNAGVCESYTEVFGLLLNFAEVENIRVTGKGNGGGHAWNLVKLDNGEWYWYDLTWDDRDTNDVYEIFQGYAAVTDYGEVTVKIGGGSFEPLYFLKKHTPGSNYSYGINYNPVLPERAADPFTTSDTMIYNTFTVEGTTYQIIRFDTVYCCPYLGIGSTPPETITYNGREYKVIVDQ